MLSKIEITLGCETTTKIWHYYAEASNDKPRHCDGNEPVEKKIVQAGKWTNLLLKQQQQQQPERRVKYLSPGATYILYPNKILYLWGLQQLFIRMLDNNNNKTVVMVTVTGPGLFLPILVMKMFRLQKLFLRQNLWKERRGKVDCLPDENH